MAIRNLGRIALGGFAVGFAAFGGAYAAGGKDLDLWESLPSWVGINRLTNIVWHERCTFDDKAEAIERRFAWEGSNDVNITIPGAIHYKVGEGEEIVVRGPAELLDHIRVEDDTIALSCNGTRNAALDVTLPGRSFREINIMGSGDVVGENLNQETIEINIAGSGSMRATGTVEKVEVSIAGSGDAKLGELTMKRLELNVAGSGNAEAGPADSAEVNVMGSGNLKLLSNPRDLETHIMGSGRIIRPAQTGI